MQGTSQKKVSFITLGCAKNEVDSAHMAARLAQAGYEVVDQELLEEAEDGIGSATEALDAIIVNTCSFLREAIEENLDVIFDVASLPSVESGRTKLVVSGCLPARFGEELIEELTEPDLFVPCDEESSIAMKLDQLFSDPTCEDSCDASADPPRLNAGPSEYVKISDGCNRFCSFCAIPFIRGRYHSFSYETIHAEIAQLVRQGTQEIVLIAQDTGIWGSDLEPKRSLAWLLDSLASAFPTTWFRVLYIQPEHVDEELLDVMVAHENICNYLDIPLQHVDADLLKAMNRRGSREEFQELLALIHSKFPLIALRTTFIVGFPGETDEQFEALCDFVSDADFDYAGVSRIRLKREPRLLRFLIRSMRRPSSSACARCAILADSVSQTSLARFIGKEVDVLVLGQEEDGALFGRSAYQAPDVDGVTFIDEGKVGEAVPIMIEDVLYYEMEGSRAR